MIYRAIGLMSGSSLDGLDVVYAEFNRHNQTLKGEIKYATCFEYSKGLREKLMNAHLLNAYEFCLLHIEFGKISADFVNSFIAKHNIQTDVIASHGHTVFHEPEKNLTTQIGDGATIAALTGFDVVNDLRMMDVALNGQGAPIVPMGEMQLFSEYKMFLNIGGIANISYHNESFVAFDVCAANGVLNKICGKIGLEYDEDGNLAKSGKVNDDLLNKLNVLEYYLKPHPKTLDNFFGRNKVFAIIEESNAGVEDALKTYCEHIAVQIKNAVSLINLESDSKQKIMVTGGGALNKFLISRINALVNPLNIEVVVPEQKIVQFKEAYIMAFLGVLRLINRPTVLSSVTGAACNSIGGALWKGKIVDDI